MFHRELFEWLQFPKFRLPLDSASGRRGSRGLTPLHWAAGNGHVSAVERLIEAKATVDAKDKNGRGLGTKGLGGKPSWGNGILVRKCMKCWWFKFFVDFLSVFVADFQPKHLHHFFWLYVVIKTVLFPSPRSVFGNKDIRVALCSWVSGVYTLMWHLPFCRSDNLNASFPFHCWFGHVRYHDQNKRVFCSVPLAGDFCYHLFSRGGVICLGLSWSKPSWLELIIPKPPCVSNNSMASRHLKPTTFLESREEFEWPPFPKLWLLRRPNFLKVLLPLVPLGSACGLALGRRLPRQNTAASGSRQGPHVSCPAASRGQGSSGCKRQKWPWPRKRIWGWKTYLRHKILYGQSSKTFARTFRVFRRVYVFCTRDNFCRRLLAWQYFGATIAIQNKFPAQFNGPWHPVFCRMTL